MAPWLTYTLLTGCGVAFFGGLWLSGSGGRGRLRRLARWSGTLQIAGLVAAYLVLRPGAGDDGRSDIEAAEAAERPIFIDMYSNF
ncbi:MAG: hypothetical protein AAF721_21935 [Myxococcota bacterium]